MVGARPDAVDTTSRVNSQSYCLDARAARSSRRFRSRATAACLRSRPCCMRPYNLLAFFDMSILAMSLASFSGFGEGAAASEPA